MTSGIPSNWYSQSGNWQQPVTQAASAFAPTALQQNFPIAYGADSPFVTNINPYTDTFQSQYIPSSTSTQPSDQANAFAKILPASYAISAASSTEDKITSNWLKKLITLGGDQIISDFMGGGRVSTAISNRFGNLPEDHILANLLSHGKKIFQRGNNLPESNSLDAVGKAKLKLNSSAVNAAEAAATRSQFDVLAARFLPSGVSDRLKAWGKKAYGVSTADNPDAIGFKDYTPDALLGIGQKTVLNTVVDGQTHELETLLQNGNLLKRTYTQMLKDNFGTLFKGDSKIAQFFGKVSDAARSGDLTGAGQTLLGGAKGYVQNALLGDHFRNISKFFAGEGGALSAGLSALNIGLIFGSSALEMKKAWDISSSNNDSTPTKLWNTVKAGGKELFKNLLSYHAACYAYSIGFALGGFTPIGIALGAGFAVVAGMLTSKATTAVIGKSADEKLKNAATA